MAINDTTNVIDSSIYMKARLKHNMVGDNYYIENLQHRRNLDWEARYNIVDIEEELDKQIEYTDEAPIYSPIDVAIRNVKSINGEDLGEDWCNIAFRDLKHPSGVGSRYRFSTDFPDMSAMTEEEKHYQTSIWLCVNRTPVRGGNSSTLRRCDTTLTLVGCESRDRSKQREIHLEPCVLENEMKYLQVYYNQNVPVPQAEWYATMQLNYFSNCIQINDRFIFGTLNPEVRENNSVYRVKAVIKPNTKHTYMQGHNDEMNSTPLVIVAMDKDMVSPEDDFVNRIAGNFSIYDVPEEDSSIVIPVPDHGDTVYDIVVEEFKDKIPLGKTATYTFNLTKDGEVVSSIIDFNIELEGIIESNWHNYYVIYETTDNSITIGNLKTCTRGKLLLTASCTIPDSTTSVSKVLEITLGKSS